MTKKREYFVSEPKGDATASVIWLHGLGADGKDFEGIVDQLGFPHDHSVRFIFPSAPFLNVTINNGMLMRGWYDIYALDMLDREDEPGIVGSKELIEDYIAHEQRLGIAFDRIVLAGFSQGGAISLYTALNFQAALAGVIVLSAYLPLTKNVLLQKFHHKQMPIFMAHGIFDPVVPFNLGQTSFEFLKQQGYAIELHNYPMHHTLCIEEIADIGSFLQRCLGYA